MVYTSPDIVVFFINHNCIVLYYCSVGCVIVWDTSGLGGSSEAFVSNLIDLGYWNADTVTHKHSRATAYHTAEMGDCSAKHSSVEAELLHVTSWYKSAVLWVSTVHGYCGVIEFPWVENTINITLRVEYPYTLETHSTTFA